MNAVHAENHVAGVQVYVQYLINFYLLYITLCSHGRMPSMIFICSMCTEFRDRAPYKHRRTTRRITPKTIQFRLHAISNRWPPFFFFFSCFFLFQLIDLIQVEWIGQNILFGCAFGQFAGQQRTQRRWRDKEDVCNQFDYVSIWFGMRASKRQPETTWDGTANFYLFIRLSLVRIPYELVKFIWGWFGWKK